jgi:NAD(P)-dependent dehydrogenase (short-subunit alcohol dehydrogenase family)
MRTSPLQGGEGKEGARKVSEKEFFSLAGQVAVVTGGGQEIGAGIARRLAAAGARVAILDVNEANARGVAEPLAGREQAATCQKTDAGPLPASGQAPTGGTVGTKDSAMGTSPLQKRAGKSPRRGRRSSWLPIDSTSLQTLRGACAECNCRFLVRWRYARLPTGRRTQNDMRGAQGDGVRHHARAGGE